MNIGILTSSLDTTNGWGRYSVNLIRALQEQGVRCTVLSEDETRPSGLNVDVIRLQSHPGSGWRNALNVLRDVLRVRKAFASVDVVHALTETHVFLAWLSGRPYVVSTHGTYTLRFFKRPFLRLFAVRAFQHASAVIITSLFTLERIKPFVTLRATINLPNGVDTDLFTERTEHVHEPHTVITVGAIKPRKGQDIGVRALAKLVERFPDVKYIIVGKREFGDFYDTLHQLINASGLKNHIVFEHDASDTRLVELYNNAGVFMLPSRIDGTDSFEGYPLALLEASACGLPIIGGRGCGAEHLIEDNKNGFLVTPEDVVGLAERLHEMFSDPERCRSMGAQAKAVAQELSWPKNAARVKTAYHSILNRTPV